MTSRTAAAILIVAALLLLGCSATTVHGGTNGRIFTVNTTADNDDGTDVTCSLREAIKASNNGANYNGCVGQNNPGTDTDLIQFALGTGNPVINVATGLDEIRSPVVIDGATGGATRVVMHGPGDATKASGLSISQDAYNSELRRLVVNNFLDGYPIEVGADGVTLVGNYIGTNAAGTSAVPNQHGVYVDGDNARIGGTTGTTPGGPCTGDCNLISGNMEYGLRMGGLDGTVEGNFIGTKVTGSDAIPNGRGIFVQGDGTLIGGTGNGAGNVVSGNLMDGIVVGALIASIQGNLIGTNSAGTEAVPNLGGVVIDSGSDPSQGVVGGSTPGSGNLISGNLSYGIAIAAPGVGIQGNLIGTDLTGQNPLPNGEEGVLVLFIQGGFIGGASVDHGNVIAFNGGDGVRVSEEAFYIQIRRNSIFSNNLKGIQIDPGSNRNINAPTILSADSSGVSGSVGAPDCVGVGSACSIDIYSDGGDEGHTYEGSTLTDVAGNWTFDGPLTGPNVTATATDDGGDTSEFSMPFTIEVPTQTPSPSPTSPPTPTSTGSPSPTPTAQAGLLGDAIQTWICTMQWPP